MNLVIPLLLGIITSVTGWLGYQTISEPDTLGAFGDPFLSLQLATSPTNGYILSTDGTNNSWIANTGGSGGGSGLFQYDAATDTISPIVASTSNTARLELSSFHATSTATSSVFYNASTTGVSATNFWGALVGNADTATALAANGANCSAGNAPLGVDASGAVESCFDVWTEAENTSAAYISGNQTITLSGDVSGSGATSITTTIGSDTVDFTMTDNTITLAGNPALEADDCFFGDSGIICEGTAADNFEGLLSFPVTTSDKTWTFPNTTGTVALLTSAMTGTFDGNNFAGGAIGQGDLLYGSAAGTISELAKDTNATRYLSNQGTSNNPSWNQVNLANGVTGTLDEGNVDWVVTSSVLDFGSATSLEIPNGSAPTVNATGEIALNTDKPSLSFATSTDGVGELPLYPPLTFAYASSSWTGTTTPVNYPTLSTFGEEITTGICNTDGSALIRVGDGTNWSNQVSLSSGTTTVSFTSNNSFNENGEVITFQIGTPSSISRISCNFSRVYKR